MKASDWSQVRTCMRKSITSKSTPPPISVKTFLVEIIVIEFKFVAGEVSDWRPRASVFVVELGSPERTSKLASEWILTCTVNLDGWQSVWEYSANRARLKELDGCKGKAERKNLSGIEILNDILQHHGFGVYGVGIEWSRTRRVTAWRRLLKIWGRNHKFRRREDWCGSASWTSHSNGVGQVQTETRRRPFRGVELRMESGWRRLREEEDEDREDGAGGFSNGLQEIKRCLQSLGFATYRWS
ncbi:hypothetical protein B0H17DRAFT_1130381 [Mycena rosella]|uniref:Uncharacterized protein n=1 Tax=Mycena rosella TaxID=1033263 RepID=A0AAD7GJB3_MYCRO|nr:hypothetical protein B0H17DRAFT_1130381 [Mycena rosella]